MSLIKGSLLGNRDMYQELKVAQNHSPELSQCVHDVMEALKASPRDAKTNLRRPVCLLGKIQSGKTRCLIGVITRAFYEDIKIVVVLTKNSTLLGKQTTQRIAGEINGLSSGRSVKVDYIRDIDHTRKLNAAERDTRRVIVGIKHHMNVNKIFEFLVKNNPELKSRELLIIDDEADISSIGYRKVGERVLNLQTGEFESQTNTENLLVSEQVLKLREAFDHHFYLQVTATPASIFLQPEGFSLVTYDPHYQVNINHRAPIRADKTVILPIHDRYTGGEFFFGQATQQGSLASGAHVAVGAAELKRLLKRDQRHINNIFASGNFPSVTHLVDNLLLCVSSHVACRMAEENLTASQLSDDQWSQVLSHLKDELGGLTAMLHMSTQIKIHGYHRDLVESYVGQCHGAALLDIEQRRATLKDRLRDHFESTILPAAKIYKAQVKSDDPEGYIARLDQVDFEEIFACYCQVLRLEHVKVTEVNSTQSGNDHIDPNTGELRRDVLANIFVGGQSLDRGITIARMVGFFYGRDPSVAQLDTTLQHARIYGARTLADLVFTRLYMTESVHSRLIEITEIDQILRDSIMNNNGDNRFAAIELGATGIRPTSPSRLMRSDCITLKSNRLLLPIGFQTRQGSACSRHVRAVDQMIKQLNSRIKGSQGECFYVDWAWFEELFGHFERYTLNRDRWEGGNRNDHWDLKRLRAYYQIMKNAYFQGDDRLLLMVRRNRKLNRYKNDGRTLQDSPSTAQRDSVDMIKLMDKTNVPGLFLFEQCGDKKEHNGFNIGWSGERFYWPVLMLPTMDRPIMISLDAL